MYFYVNRCSGHHSNILATLLLKFIKGYFTALPDIQTPFPDPLLNKPKYKFTKIKKLRQSKLPSLIANEYVSSPLQPDVDTSKTEAP